MKESAEIAVGRLFEEHGARLYRLGVRFCGNADEAHDLVQDVFLQAFRSWQQFDGRSSPSTWLFTMAARRCQRRHRRRAGEPAQVVSLSTVLPSPDGPIADLDGPLDDVVRTQLRERVAAAVRELPDWMRLPLILAEIAEMPLADVALILGLKVGTVKSRVHRARLAVRHQLASELPSRQASSPPLDRQLCFDLLHAKQEALDRNVPFPLEQGELCERCRSLFATMDLTRDVCRELGSGEMPADVAALIRAEIARGKKRKSRALSR
jgi:RNA polymerase sigma factor (sigma-70 family)